MDIQLLIHPDIQDRVRSLILRVMIEKNINRQQLSSSCKVGSAIISRFLGGHQNIGQNGMRRFAHFLVSNGYTVEQILQQD